MPPTSTRQELRRALALELGMPFAKRFPAGRAMTGLLTDLGLATMPTDFWKGAWLYDLELDQVMPIAGFYAGVYKPERSIESSAGHAYEIHSIWNANDLHMAINRAIEEGYPSFFDTTVNLAHAHRESRAEHLLTDVNPWIVQKVFLEYNPTRLQCQISAKAYDALTETYTFTINAGLPAYTADYLMSAVDGAEAGKVFPYALTRLTETSFTYSGVDPVDLEVGDTVVIWHPSQSLWHRLYAVTFDKHEFPVTMRLLEEYPNSYGLRLKIEALIRPAPLAADIDTTVVPKEYVLRRAMSLLFGQRVNDNRADRQRYQQLEEYHRQLSEQYRLLRSFRVPEGTMWQASDRASLGSHGPLEWDA